MARYSGFPPGARLFVPDYIAGSNATQPTAGGDLGYTPSGGKYTGGSGALLLALVRLTDANGAGGYLAGPAPPSGVMATLDSASEVPLPNGSGVVVYEVVESNSAQQESAQFPAFIVYTPPVGGGSTAQATPASELRAGFDNRGWTRFRAEFRALPLSRRQPTVRRCAIATRRTSPGCLSDWRR